MQAVCHSQQILFFFGASLAKKMLIRTIEKHERTLAFRRKSISVSGGGDIHSGGNGLPLRPERIVCLKLFRGEIKQIFRKLNTLVSD